MEREKHQLGIQNLQHNKGMQFYKGNEAPVKKERTKKVKPKPVVMEQEFISILMKHGLIEVTGMVDLVPVVPIYTTVGGKSLSSMMSAIYEILKIKQG